MAWLSLDPADNEPASFWTYVVTALQRRCPASARVRSIIASSPSPTELVLTTLVNELAAAPREVWLVLDDYHLVDGHDVSDGLAFLLEHLPPHVHVVLSTRADPDLPLARWRVRGELVEVRAADLRFTSDEAAAYLNEWRRPGSRRRGRRRLEDAPRGGSPRCSSPRSRCGGARTSTGFIAQFAGDDRYIVDYLVEEVLRAPTRAGAPFPVALSGSRSAQRAAV